MQTTQIPESEWAAFLDRFSSRHYGWLMNLEIFSPDIGAQAEGRKLVLEGLTNEYDEMHGNTIIITAGDKPDQHVTHSINRPGEISIERTAGGEDEALLIKGQDGTRTLLTFPGAV